MIMEQMFPVLFYMFWEKDYYTFLPRLTENRVIYCNSSLYKKMLNKSY